LHYGKIELEELIVFMTRIMFEKCILE
jgi:hypothetical protein